jgi:hypothetical protein
VLINGGGGSRQLLATGSLSIAVVLSKNLCDQSSATRTLTPGAAAVAAASTTALFSLYLVALSVLLTSVRMRYYSTTEMCVRAPAACEMSASRATCAAATQCIDYCQTSRSVNARLLDDYTAATVLPLLLPAQPWPAMCLSRCSCCYCCY